MQAFWMREQQMQAMGQVRVKEAPALFSQHLQLHACAAFANQPQFFEGMQTGLQAAPCAAACQTLLPLSPAAQHVDLMLLTKSDLNLCV